MSVIHSRNESLRPPHYFVLFPIRKWHLADVLICVSLIRLLMDPILKNTKLAVAQ